MVAFCVEKESFGSQKGGIPLLDPVNDMGISVSGFSDLVKQAKKQQKDLAATNDQVKKFFRQQQKNQPPTPAVGSKRRSRDSSSSTSAASLQNEAIAAFKQKTELSDELRILRERIGAVRDYRVHM